MNFKSTVIKFSSYLLLSFSLQTITSQLFSGSTTDSGKDKSALQKPFLTIDHVCDKIRNFSSPKTDKVHINIRIGIYHLNFSFKIKRLR